MGFRIPGTDWAIGKVDKPEEPKPAEPPAESQAAPEPSAEGPPPVDETRPAEAGGAAQSEAPPAESATPASDAVEPAVAKQQSKVDQLEAEVSAEQATIDRAEGARPSQLERSPGRVEEPPAPDPEQQDSVEQARQRRDQARGRLDEEKKTLEVMSSQQAVIGAQERIGEQSQAAERAAERARAAHAALAEAGVEDLAEPGARLEAEARADLQSEERAVYDDYVRAQTDAEHAVARVNASAAQGEAAQLQTLAYVNDAAYAPATERAYDAFNQALAPQGLELSKPQSIDEALAGTDNAAQRAQAHDELSRAVPLAHEKAQAAEAQLQAAGSAQVAAARPGNDELQNLALTDRLRANDQSATAAVHQLENAQRSLQSAPLGAGETQQAREQRLQALEVQLQQASDSRGQIHAGRLRNDFAQTLDADNRKPHQAWSQFFEANPDAKLGLDDEQIKQMTDKPGRSWWRSGLEIAGGVAGVVVGGLLVASGVGAPLGAAMIFGGASLAVGTLAVAHGASDLALDQQTDPFISQGLQAAGMSQDWASRLDTGITLGASLPAGAMGVASIGARAASAGLTLKGVTTGAATAGNGALLADQAQAGARFVAGDETAMSITTQTIVDHTGWTREEADALTFAVSLAPSAVHAARGGFARPGTAVEAAAGAAQHADAAATVDIGGLTEAYNTIKSAGFADSPQLAEAYRTLGLEVTATEAQVRQARKDLVFSNHPDRAWANADDPAHAEAIAQAEVADADVIDLASRRRPANPDPEPPLAPLQELPLQQAAGAEGQRYPSATASPPGRSASRLGVVRDGPDRAPGSAEHRGPAARNQVGDDDGADQPNGARPEPPEGAAAPGTAWRAQIDQQHQQGPVPEGGAPGRVPLPDKVVRVTGVDQLLPAGTQVFDSVEPATYRMKDSALVRVTETGFEPVALKNVLGPVLGYGSDKVVFALGSDRAVGVYRHPPRQPGERSPFAAETEALRHLREEIGVPAVDAELGPDIDGSVATILYDLHSLHMDEVINPATNTIWRPDALTPQVTAELTGIRARLEETDTAVIDFELLFTRAGDVVIADPAGLVTRSTGSRLAHLPQGFFVTDLNADLKVIRQFVDAAELVQSSYRGLPVQLQSRVPEEFRHWDSEESWRAAQGRRRFDYVRVQGDHLVIFVGPGSNKPLDLSTALGPLVGQDNQKLTFSLGERKAVAVFTAEDSIEQARQLRDAELVRLRAMGVPKVVAEAGPDVHGLPTILFSKADYDGASESGSGPAREGPVERSPESPSADQQPDARLRQLDDEVAALQLLRGQLIAETKRSDATPAERKAAFDRLEDVSGQLGGAVAERESLLAQRAVAAARDVLRLKDSDAVRVIARAAALSPDEAALMAIRFDDLVTRDMDLADKRERLETAASDPASPDQRAKAIADLEDLAREEQALDRELASVADIHRYDAAKNAARQLFPELGEPLPMQDLIGFAQTHVRLGELLSEGRGPQTPEARELSALWRQNAAKLGIDTERFPNPAGDTRSDLFDRALARPETAALLEASNKLGARLEAARATGWKFVVDESARASHTNANTRTVVIAANDAADPGRLHARLTHELRETSLVDDPGQLPLNRRERRDPGLAQAKREALADLDVQIERRATGTDILADAPQMTTRTARFAGAVGEWSGNHLPTSVDRAIRTAFARLGRSVYENKPSSLDPSMTISEFARKHPHLRAFSQQPASGEPPTRTNIIATLGPASATRETVGAMLDKGVSVFRLRDLHGGELDPAATAALVRDEAGARARTASIIVDTDIVDTDNGGLAIAVDMEAEYVAMSGITDASQIAEAQEYMRNRAAARGSLDTVPFILAKIQTSEAIQRPALDAIVEASDGVIVDRGALAGAVDIEAVPGHLAAISELAYQMDKPLVVTTDMLGSMVVERRATRAEVSDVSNAVLSRAHALMLGSSTEIGLHPLRVVDTMQQVVREAEAGPERGTPMQPLPENPNRQHHGRITADAAVEFAQETNAAAIVALTTTGLTPKWMTQSTVPVYAYAIDEAVPGGSAAIRRQMALYRNVHAERLPEGAQGLSGDAQRQAIEQQLVGYGVLKEGDSYVVTSSAAASGATGTTAHRSYVVGPSDGRAVVPARGEPHNRTNIVASIGPSTDKPEVMAGLLREGLDVARINLSHGDPAHHGQVIQQLRAEADRQGSDVAVMVDLQGPKIRIGEFDGGRAVLRQGQQFVLDTRSDVPGDSTRVGLEYKTLADNVEVGDKVLLADGAIELNVADVDKEAGTVTTTVLNEGEVTVSNRKGINKQGGGLAAAALTSQDYEHLALAVRWRADYVAVSFVKSAEDMTTARNFAQAQVDQLNAQRGSDEPEYRVPSFIPKIETAEAVQRDALEGIMRVSDALMVARGDLGVEVGAAKVPGYQSLMLDMAREMDVPVIVATEVLESMLKRPIPTAAEVSDVANAVLDGADAVMLSGETAAGGFPIEAERTLRESIRRAEAGPQRGVALDPLPENPRREHTDYQTAKTAVASANRAGAKAIVALTESGATAAYMSTVEANRIPIFAFSPDNVAAARLQLYQNVEAGSINPLLDLPSALREVEEHLVARGVLQQGDSYVVTSGPMGVSGGTNAVTVRRVGA